MASKNTSSKNQISRKKAVDFFKNNKFFLLGLLVLLWVIFINIFPAGYVFSGGDTAQFIETGDSFKSLFYSWNGISSLFYLVFFILGKIGIGNTAQLSFLLGFIIFGSYFSFWLFSRLIMDKSSDLTRSAASLFYALNLYTLFLFTGNWGYSYFPSLYVFIPILIGLFLKFIKTEDFFYGIFFCIVLFFASVGFGNPAFALSFGILILFLVIAAALLKIAKPGKKFLLELFLILVLSLLVSLFWILPVIPQMKSGVELLNTSNVLEFNYEIRNTASPIFNSISLMHFSSDYFPLNFYYKNADFLKPIFVALAFVPIIIATVGIYFSGRIKEKKVFFLFLFLLLFFTMLSARVVAPFETINFRIFHIWGFNTLRGFDKTAIYIPFFLSVLILMTITEAKKKKWLYILLFLALITPLPFFIGKIQQNAGLRVSTKKDYKTAPMSFLLKIPNEYYKIRNIINNDKEKSSIATLPASRNDGSGISYYPKWNLYGADITAWLYNKKIIPANAQPFPNWYFTRDFGTDSSGNYGWIAEIFGMMNAKYIIFHKDAPSDSVEETQYKMKILEEEKILKNIKENDYFTLYEINDNLVSPYISWQKENINIDPNSDSVWRNFDRIKELSKKAVFQEINPKKYAVNWDNSEFSGNLILAETFDPLWKAYYVSKNGEETEIEDHFLARGFANGWKIENNPMAEKIVIEYYPIKLIWKGMVVSFATVLLLIIYIVYSRMAEKKRLE